MPVCRPTVSAIRPSRPVSSSLLALLAASLGTAAVSAAPMPIQEGRTLTYKVRDEQVQAYLVRPQKAGSYPGVVIIHEWWGLNEQIKHVADRLAEDGYMVLAPDLYKGKLGTDAGLAHDLMRALNEGWAVEVVTGAVAQLRGLDVRERRGTPTGQRIPVGMIGFDMGGRLSLATALAGADVQAVVSYYGTVETKKETLQSLSVPLLGIYGNEDFGIPLDQIRAFEAALKEEGKDATILVYPGVGHAFFNEDRPSYDAETAKDSWERTRMFLRKNLTADATAAAPPVRRTTPEP